MREGSLSNRWELGQELRIWVWCWWQLDEVFIQTTPWTERWVVESLSAWLQRSTNNPKWYKKISTNDSMWYVCHYKNPAECPISRVSERIPKVGLSEPLIAFSNTLPAPADCSLCVGGTMLTCALVSTKKRKLELKSCMWKRRPVNDRPATLVAANDRPWSLTSKRRGICFSVPSYQICGGTSRAFQKWQKHRQMIP